jgi:DNA-binding PadR family transcriptional regulator
MIIKLKDPLSLMGGRRILLSLFIRDYLMEHGEASPYDIVKAIKENLEEKERRKVSYQNVRNYFYLLRKLGLIEPSGRVEPSSKPYLQPKIYYKLTEKGLSTPPESLEWRDPHRALYPESWERWH